MLFSESGHRARSEKAVRRKCNQVQREAVNRRADRRWPPLLSKLTSTAEEAPRNTTRAGGPAGVPQLSWEEELSPSVSLSTRLSGVGREGWWVFWTGGDSAYSQTLNPWVRMKSTAPRAPSPWGVQANASEWEMTSTRACVANLE